MKGRRRKDKEEKTRKEGTVKNKSEGQIALGIIPELRKLPVVPGLSIIPKLSLFILGEAEAKFSSLKLDNHDPASGRYLIL